MPPRIADGNIRSLISFPGVVELHRGQRGAMAFLADCPGMHLRRHAAERGTDRIEVFAALGGFQRQPAHGFLGDALPLAALACPGERLRSPGRGGRPSFTFHEPQFGPRP